MNTPKNLIISDPNIMMGKPVIAGTRLTVELIFSRPQHPSIQPRSSVYSGCDCGLLILEKLAAGETREQILEAHPRLTPDAIQAALAFAAEALPADVVYPTTKIAA